MQKRIIGIVGEIGSGKATFVKLLTQIASKKYTVGSETFSNILVETLDLWRLPKTRENTQKLPVIMREAYGRTVLSQAVFKRVENLNKDIILLDGVRWKSDLEYLRKIHKSLLVYITADPKIRYQRIRARGEKTGENKTSYKKFLNQHKAPADVEIPQIALNADFKIINNGSINEYYAKIQEFYEKFLI